MLMDNFIRSCITSEKVREMCKSMQPHMIVKSEMTIFYFKYVVKIIDIEHFD